GNSSDGNSLLGDTTSAAQWGTPPQKPTGSPYLGSGYGYYVYPYVCRGGIDSSFCAVSTLTTTVSSRITDNN
ncbi:MAG TPA: hypothetical protein VGF75_03000, partial [Candidatus Saccharimonadales bacterium]